MDKNALISVTVILNAPDIELTLWGEFATPLTLRSKGLVRNIARLAGGVAMIYFTLSRETICGDLSQME